MQRLLPAPPGPTTPDALAAAERRRLGDRPWIGWCMIASLDGSTALGGVSRGLGSANDAAVLGALRRAADMIVVGASTASGERYGPPRKRGQRIGVVTSRGRIDPTGALFASGAGFVITTEDAPAIPGVDMVRAGRGRIDLRLALSRLGAVGPEPTFVHAEGGPTLNGALFAADCVDELNLTLAPAIVGGDGRRLVDGAEERLVGYDLVQLATDERSFLFGRWRRRGG